MEFENLKEKCEYYKNTSNYTLDIDKYVLLMLDGRSFSKFCKKFIKPYDDVFINIMNETAKYLCDKIEGVKLAFVQSDEISLVIAPPTMENQTPWFKNRLNKIQSISASAAASKFNNLMTIVDLKKAPSIEEGIKMVENRKLIEFDSKAWNVESYNDVFAWFLYRQIDCVRNSKQMAAQTFIPHSKLLNLNTDEQIQLLKDKTGIDWNEYENGKKFGRFINKQKVILNQGTDFEAERTKWFVEPCFELYKEENREMFEKIIIPQDVETIQ